MTGDTVSSQTVELEPVEETIKVTSERSILRSSETGTVTRQDHDFADRFPVAVQNPQQLTGLLVSNPGFVPDSANQVHPRGEHSATSIYIQGFQLGGAAQGRFGPLIAPEALENLDVITGGFAPEYAGDAALLNTTVRSGPIQPFFHVEGGGGEYSTRFGSFSLGGQAGEAIGAPDEQGHQTKGFAYFLTGSSRTTENALEPPQPHHQSDHNHGTSQTLLGKFDFTPTETDTFSLIVNYSPARTDVANRTGLPDKYAPYGQGYPPYRLPIAFLLCPKPRTIRAQNPGVAVFHPCPKPRGPLLRSVPIRGV